MKRGIALVLVAIGAAVASCGPTRAAGTTPPPTTAVDAEETPRERSPLDVPGVGTLTAAGDAAERGRVTLERVAVDARQAGDMVEVEAVHTFRSDAEAALEGTFRFPLPEGAILTGLSMWIDGKKVDGELVEREKARQAFEQIVDEMQDPALLEWEHGSTFKMRVFPIEPHADKVVAVRYLAPLEHRGPKWTFSQSARSPGGEAVKHLEVAFQGKKVADERDVPPDRIFDVPATPPPSAVSDVRKDATYTLVRVTPDWNRVPLDARPAPKNVVVVVDTSRSALEERKVGVESLRAALAALPPGSRFVVLTSDVDVRVMPGGFVAATAEATEAALRFVEETPDDGATDLGLAMERAGALATEAGSAAVLYFGDCEPTWGEVRPQALAEKTAAALGAAPLHVVLLGAARDADTAELLTERTGGTVVRARRLDDVKAFVSRLGRPERRITSLEVSVDVGTPVLFGERRTLAAGDELVVAILSEPGLPVPPAVTLRGVAAGKPVSFTTKVHAVPARFGAERYGALRIKQLERMEKPKPEIVEASLAYGVMSKYTSFLVLENEEAYERFQIARKAKEVPDDPRVTGGNLESADGDQASVSLSSVQPGDPEIFVPAPEDALSVRVVLPTGEVKLATYDREADHGRGAWMVRFLVPRETKEGVYEARAEVVLRDGSLEVHTVTYTVDDTPPELEVDVHPSLGRPGFVTVRVTQRGPALTADLRRVEIATPDGALVELPAVKWGEFDGTFRRTAAWSGGTLRVVGFDQAQNHAALEVVLP